MTQLSVFPNKYERLHTAKTKIWRGNIKEMKDSPEMNRGANFTQLWLHGGASAVNGREASGVVGGGRPSYSRHISPVWVSIQYAESESS